MHKNKMQYKPHYFISYLLIILQLVIPISLSTQTAFAATAMTMEENDILIKNSSIETEPYILKVNEDTLVVAKKYGLTIDKLKKINVYRTFSKPFEKLSTGDEIDVPKKMFTRNQIVKTDNNDISLLTMQENLANTLSSLKDNTNIDKIAEDKAKNYILNNANESVQGWFGQFGTVKGSFIIDDDYSLEGSELDLLIPFYDTEKVLFYTQLGGRYINDRATLNTGLGSRLFTQNNWMLGGNLFFDADITGRNQRIGLGIEAWRDYLKLSANQYIGLTSWHQSRDFNDYNERPANGFDIRAEGYLPFYPQIGANLIYETYQGNEVALFGKDERQTNPYAFTLGANYTPFPLVTLGIDHRVGKSNKEDTSLNLHVNYRFGESLQNQLSGSSVDNMRQLSQSRYDLVNRNNEIVLDYKKQELIKLSLPDSKTGNGGDKISVTALVSSKYKVKDIDWDDSNFPTGGITANAEKDIKDIVEITLPDYDYNSKNTYQLKAKATDINGNNSNTASMLIVVAAPSLESANLILNTDKNSAIADESDQIIATAILTDSNGTPIERQKINFSIDGANLSIIEGETDRYGSLKTRITNHKIVDTTITANLKNVSGKNAYANVSFIADSSSAKIDTLVVTQNNAPANGTDINKVKATVIDNSGNPVTNQTVTFSATNGATVITTSVQTDNNGHALTTLTHTQIGKSQVTASINNSSKTVAVTFIADSSSAKIDTLVVTQNNAIANGADTNNVQATVTDSSGNLVTNQTVTFSATNGATVITTSVQTDNNGQALTTLTHTQIGQSQVTASTNNSQKTVAVTFIADSSSAKIDTLVVTQDNAIANGADTNNVQATVTDSSGNLVTNQIVTFSATNGATVITTSVQTDNNGQALTTLTHTQIGQSQVTASTNNTQKTVTVMFIADSNSAKIDTLVVTQDNAIANGTDTNNVQATVTDSLGNLVTNQTVTFSATNGATVITTSVQTDNNGQALTTLTHTQIGQSQVTASTKNSSKTVAVMFIADNSSAKIDTLVVTQDNAIANGADTNNVQATVTDSLGNLVTNQIVTFSATNGATVITTSIQTDNNGQALTTLTHTQIGQSQVTASTNNSSKTVAVMFIADNSSAKIDTLVVTQDNAIANGSDTNAVKATVTNSSGNLIINQTVTFSATNGATVITASVQTDDNGQAVTTLTNTKTGISQVTANTNNTSKVENVTFKREPLNIKIDSVNVNKSTYEIKTPESSVFPKSGFKNAKFQILINGNPPNKDEISWRSSNSNNASVDNEGFVTLLQKSNEQITITAQDKQYPNNKSEFTFVIKNWFLYSDR